MPRCVIAGSAYLESAVPAPDHFFTQHWRIADGITAGSGDRWPPLSAGREDRGVSGSAVCFHLLPDHWSQPIRDSLSHVGLNCEALLF